MDAGTTYLERYLAGEHKAVWAELAGLGERVREEPVYSDAWAVACETMRRVRANIERLIPRLVQVGFVFGYGHLIQEELNRPAQGADWTRYLRVLEWSRAQPPVFLPARLAEEYRDEMISMDLGDLGPEVFDPGVAAPDMRAHIEELERMAGPLPLSLRAWYAEVGAVNFYGYHPGWTRFMLRPDGRMSNRERFLMSWCDPLQVCVLDAVRMRDLRRQHARGHLHKYEFAEDPYFKDYTAGSGASFAFALPNPTMDGTLYIYESRPTFVDYLRRCMHWGGIPGHGRVEGRAGRRPGVLEGGPDTLLNLHPRRRAVER